MPDSVGKFLLKALVIGVGVQLGAGIYEARIVVPQWSAVPPKDMSAAIERSGFKGGGRKFWAFVSPPVALLSIANLLAARRTTGMARPWWLAAAGTMTLVSAATYGYFVPAAIRLFDAGQLPPSQVEVMVSRWVRLSPLRMVAGLAALLAGVQALLLLGRDEAARERAGTSLPPAS